MSIKLADLLPGMSSSARQALLDCQRRCEGLPPSQRAALAAGVVPLLYSEAKHQRRRGVTMPLEKRSIAALAAGCGKTTVGNALLVWRKDPELFQRILDGGLGVEQAYRLLDSRPAQKAAPASIPAAFQNGHRIKSNARAMIVQKAARRKLISMVSVIRGACRGFETFQTQNLAGVLTDEERAHWAHAAYGCAKILRTFARQLEANHESNDDDDGGAAGPGTSPGQRHPAQG